MPSSSPTTPSRCRLTRVLPNWLALVPRPRPSSRRLGCHTAWSSTTRAVASERIIAVADLYYIYQHEKLGVFRAIQKLQQLFRAGTIQLSSGRGAYALYQFDRREVLRYTRKDRIAAYRKAFGFGMGSVPAGSRANTDFGRMFTHFNNEVALFWRDKRISDVMRERAYDPSFGSIAVVRRAGLDLRNNLKFMSYGHLNVLRVEVMQLLDEAFRILGAEDVKKQFGADTAWDVIESILVQHFNEALFTSPRQRMAVAGREVLRWLRATACAAGAARAVRGSAVTDRRIRRRMAHQRAIDRCRPAHPRR